MAGNGWLGRMAVVGDKGSFQSSLYGGLAAGASVEGLYRGVLLGAFVRKLLWAFLRI
jgi:hypothetical protein